MGGLACGAALAAAVACSSSTSDSFGGLDGTWDVIAIGDAELAPSSLTISNGIATGAFITPREGTTNAQGCKYVQDRLAFSFTVRGNSLAGKMEEITERTGEGDCAYKDVELSANITGTRTSGDGDALDGDWVLSADGDKPLKVTVDGNSIHVADEKHPFDFTNDDGLIVSTSKYAQFSFRKR